MKTKRLRIVLLPLSLGRTFLEHGLDAFLELPVQHPKGLCSSCHLRHLLPLTEPSHCWGALWPWYMFKMLDSYIMYTLFHDSLSKQDSTQTSGSIPEAWYFLQMRFPRGSHALPFLFVQCPNGTGYLAHELCANGLAAQRRLKAKVSSKTWYWECNK